MYNKNPMGLFTEFMRRYFAAMGQTTASQVDPEAWRQMAEDMARKLTEAVDTEASERTPPSPHANEAGAGRRSAPARHLPPRPSASTSLVNQSHAREHGHESLSAPVHRSGGTLTSPG